MGNTLEHYPTTNEEKPLTPEDVVTQLDKYIIGQAEAKRSVAIALRNRWRRQQVPEELRDEISPKNILMIGPTGVGKTEIARRLAKLSQAPFIKVEASKFTEVGYVGRDVESMVRDLVDYSHKLIMDEEIAASKPKARKKAEEIVIQALLHEKKQQLTQNPDPEYEEQLSELFAQGMLDDRYIDIALPESSNSASVQFFSPAGNFGNEIESNIQDIFKGLIPKKKKSKRVQVKDAILALEAEEVDSVIDQEEVAKKTIKRAEQLGIIFIDEIDKITSSSQGTGPDVSREGVQRDLLPIVEGSTVKTKYGFIKTDHILFIASGAFHVAKPSDLIPELQGRFPIRVTLHTLTENDFIRILKEPKNSLIKQYIALLKTENLEVIVTDEAVTAIAKTACLANEKMQNIGARRLHTVMEQVFDDYSFKAADMAGQTVTIDAKYVHDRLDSLVENKNLNRYIL